MHAATRLECVEEVVGPVRLFAVPPQAEEILLRKFVVLAETVDVHRSPAKIACGDTGADARVSARAVGRSSGEVDPIRQARVCVRPRQRPVVADADLIPALLGNRSQPYGTPSPGGELATVLVVVPVQTTFDWSEPGDGWLVSASGHRQYASRVDAVGGTCANTGDASHTIRLQPRS